MFNKVYKSISFAKPVKKNDAPKIYIQNKRKLFGQKPRFVRHRLNECCQYEKMTGHSRLLTGDDKSYTRPFTFPAHTFNV